MRITKFHAFVMLCLISNFIEAAEPNPLPQIVLTAAQSASHHGSLNPDLIPEGPATSGCKSPPPSANLPRYFKEGGRGELVLMHNDTPPPRSASPAASSPRLSASLAKLSVNPSPRMGLRKPKYHEPIRLSSPPAAAAAAASRQKIERFEEDENGDMVLVVNPPLATHSGSPAASSSSSSASRAESAITPLAALAIDQAKIVNETRLEYQKTALELVFELQTIDNEDKIVEAVDQIEEHCLKFLNHPLLKPLLPTYSPLYYELCYYRRELLIAKHHYHTICINTISERNTFSKSELTTAPINSIFQKITITNMRNHASKSLMILAQAAAPSTAPAIIPSPIARGT